MRFWVELFSGFLPVAFTFLSNRPIDPSLFLPSIRYSDEKWLSRPLQRKKNAFMIRPKSAYRKSWDLFVRYSLCPPIAYSSPSNLCFGFSCVTWIGSCFSSRLLEYPVVRSNESDRKLHGCQYWFKYFILRSRWSRSLYSSSQSSTRSRCVPPLPIHSHNQHFTTDMW